MNINIEGFDRFKKTESSSKDHLADIYQVQVCYIGLGEFGAYGISGINLKPPVDH